MSTIGGTHFSLNHDYVRKGIPLHRYHILGENHTTLQAPETEKIMIQWYPVCFNIDVIKIWDLLENKRYCTFLEMGIQRIKQLRKHVGCKEDCVFETGCKRFKLWSLKKAFLLKKWIPCLHVPEHVICQPKRFDRTKRGLFRKPPSSWFWGPGAAKQGPTGNPSKVKIVGQRWGVSLGG